MNSFLRSVLPLALLATQLAAQTAPTIVRQPIPAVSLPPGGAFGHSAGIIGTGPISYQWSKDGVPVPGKTTDGLGINGVTPADAGSYVLTATNAYGSVSTRPMHLYVSADRSSYLFVTASPGLVYLSGGSTLAVANPTGPGPYTFQWYRRSEPIPGATGQTYDLNDGVSVVGDPFYVVVSNGTASATSGIVALASGSPPAAPPSITSQPSGPASVDPGQTVTLAVSATGPGQISYAWFRNGVLQPGGMTPTFTISSAQISDSGDYHVLVANSAGSVRSNTVRVTVTTPPPSQDVVVPPAEVVAQVVANAVASAVTVITPSGPEAERLVAISTRSLLTGGGDPIIAGFVISGSEPKTVLIRAVGPALLQQGLTEAAENPRLTLYGGSNVLRTNDDWETGNDGPTLVAAAARSGAAPLAPGSRDAAIVVTLAPGVYTAHVNSAGGRDGIALVEVYDAGEGASASRISGISTRSFAGTGERTLIAGLVITGDNPHQVLIRGVGPSLAQQGVPNAMPNPVLEVYRGSTLIASNDDWYHVLNGPITAIQAAAVGSDPTIVAANNQTGAAPLVIGGRDAAMVLTLAPGIYTAQIKPAAGSPGGSAMIEAYEVSPVLPPSPPAPPPPPPPPLIPLPVLVTTPVVAPPPGL